MKQLVTGEVWAAVRAKANAEGRITVRELLPYWSSAARAAFDGRIEQLTEIQELLKRGLTFTV